MKFPKDTLIDLIQSPPPAAYTLVENNLPGSGRWSSYQTMVFGHGGKLYRTHYSRGATECQDERPFEYEGSEVECEEVYPVSVVRVEYLPHVEAVSRGAL